MKLAVIVADHPSDLHRKGTEEESYKTPHQNAKTGLEIDSQDDLQLQTHVQKEVKRSDKSRTPMNTLSYFQYSKPKCRLIHWCPLSIRSLHSLLDSTSTLRTSSATNAGKDF